MTMDYGAKRPNARRLLLLEAGAQRTLSGSIASSSSAVQQWHHVAAEILGAGDKVIKDTHDAFETLD